MQTDDATSRELLLTEYERIKDEQRARIAFRDNLLYVTLASMASVVAASLMAHSRIVLLFLPLALNILGWTYLVNDEKISAIGGYIRRDLAPRLARTAAVDFPIFGWETAHRSDRRRVSRKYLQLCVDIMTFCISSVAAIVAYWASDSTPPPLVVLSILELAVTAVLASQIVRYADIGSGR